MTEPVAWPWFLLLGGILALDRVAFLQSMVSRPLPAGLIAGWMTGDVTAGLWAGIFIELIWLYELPVGGVIPPDEITATLGAVFIASCLPGDWPPESRASFGTVLGLVYGKLGRRFDLYARERNTGLYGMVEQKLSEGDVSSIARAQLRGALNFALAGAAGALLVVATAGPVTRFVVGFNPQAFKDGMGIMSVILPMVGVGALLRCYTGFKLRSYYTLGILGGLLSKILALWSVGSMMAPISKRNPGHER